MMDGRHSRYFHNRGPDTMQRQDGFGRGVTGHGADPNGFHPPPQSQQGQDLATVNEEMVQVWTESRTETGEYGQQPQQQQVNGRATTMLNATSTAYSPQLIGKPAQAQYTQLTAITGSNQLEEKLKVVSPQTSFAVPQMLPTNVKERHRSGNGQQYTNNGSASTALAYATTAAGTPIQSQPLVPVATFMKPGLSSNPQHPSTNYVPQPLLPPWTPVPLPHPCPEGVPSSVIQCIDPGLAAAAAEWSESFDSRYGRTFYHNIKTKLSIWEKPKVLLDLDYAKHAAAVSAMAEQQVKGRESTKKKGKSGGELEFTPTKKTKLHMDTPAAELPVSSFPIPRTSWSLVWTGDGKMFYYNSLSKTSVWTRPPELAFRLDVNEMINKISNEGQGQDQEKSVTKKEQKRIGKIEVVATNNASPAGQHQDPRISTTTLNGGVQSTSSSSSARSRGASTENEPEFNEKIKPHDVVQAEQTRAKVPFETRRAQFLELLAEKQISAFSSWERELHKIIYDRRYLLLLSHERRQTFDSYVSSLAKKEREAHKQEVAENREKFIAFLRRVIRNPKMTYMEFSRRYYSEQEYKLVKRCHDREAYFSDFMRREKVKIAKAAHEACVKKESIRKAFDNLLREKIIDCKTSWPEAKKLIGNDPRYEAMEADEREDTFKFFCRCLCSELKAKKEKEESRLKWRKKFDKPVPEVVTLDDSCSTVVVSSASATTSSDDSRSLCSQSKCSSSPTEEGCISIDEEGAD